MTLTLKAIHEALASNYTPPFMDEGIVKSRLITLDGDTPDAPSREVLEIRIGPRDIWLEADGTVSASGTSFQHHLETVEHV